MYLRWPPSTWGVAAVWLSLITVFSYYAAAAELHQFSDGSQAVNITFDTPGSNASVSFKVKKNSTITNASLSVSGYKHHIVDQAQLIGGWSYQVEKNRSYGQTFDPHKDTISAISVPIWRLGSPTDLVVEIREAYPGSWNPTSTVVFQKTISSTSIPTETTWVFIETNNLTINESKNYTIVLRENATGTADGSNGYRWVCGDGSGYYLTQSDDHGNSWVTYPFRDRGFMFKTYYSNTPLNVTVDIGDGVTTWNHIGELNASSSPKLIQMNISALQGYIDFHLADVRGYVEVPINISIRSGGIVELRINISFYNNDLAIQDITTNPAYGHKDESLTITAVIENRGEDGYTKNAEVTFYINGSPIGLDHVFTEETWVVDIYDYYYSPTQLTVPLNSTVRWKNLGGVAHTVTSDDGAFASGDIAPGDSWAHLFSQLGTYPYHDDHFPTAMRGNITVASWDEATISWTPQEDGFYDITVRVDEARQFQETNESNNRAAIQLIVDSSTPTTTDNAPKGWQPTAFNVSLLPYDALSGVAYTSYRVDNGSWYNGTRVLIDTQGNHTIEYYSVDNAGNVEPVKKAYAALDLSHPAVTVYSPLNTTYTAATVDLNYTASTEGSPISWVGYSLDGSANVTLLGNITLTGLSDGPHTLVVCSNNTLGRMNCEEVVFIVKIPRPAIPTGGGGGGGGAAPSPLGATQTIKKIEAGEIGRAVFPEEDSPYIREISVVVKQRTHNIKVTVQTLKKKPSYLEDPEGEVFSYLSIRASGIYRANLKRAEIKFQVNRSWLKENNISKNTVVLTRSTGGRWIALPTQVVDEDPKSIYYEATAPGFSYFAITGKPNSGYTEKEEAASNATPPSSPPPTTLPPTTPPATVAPALTTTPPPTTLPPSEAPLQASKRRQLLLLAAIAAITVVAGAGSVALKIKAKNKRRKKYVADASSIKVAASAGTLDGEAMYYMSRDEFNKLDAEIRSSIDITIVEVTGEEIEEYGGELAAISSQLGLPILKEREGGEKNENTINSFDSAGP
jgi:PGF-pre-PGF domain-containing protein